VKKVIQSIFYLYKSSATI